VRRARRGELGDQQAVRGGGVGELSLALKQHRALLLVAPWCCCFSVLACCRRVVIRC
jgi:hypothetical protein